MTDIEILQVLIKAKELGITVKDLEAFKDVSRETKVPDTKAEDLVVPLSVLDEMSVDEVLYYATPFYDELQYRKEEQKKKAKEE